MQNYFVSGLQISPSVVNFFKNIFAFLKGILRPIFYVDINTHIDMKLKIMQNLLQETIFLKMFQFLLTFFIDIITPVISSTQIACDVMCAQYVIH